MNVPPYNRRYVNYARVHGRTPEEQIAWDSIEWPSAKFLPFTEWNNARLGEYAHVNPKAFFFGILTPWDHHGGRPKLHDHEAYDAWLDQYPVNSPQE